jgi:hypothetical protein
MATFVWNISYYKQESTRIDSIRRSKKLSLQDILAKEKLSLHKLQKSHHTGLLITT